MSWNSRRLYFHFQTIYAFSQRYENVPFLWQTLASFLYPLWLSARCSIVYLDHLLLTLLTENPLLLCVLWLFVCFTLASFYKSRMLRKQLRRWQRHKRSRFRRCSQLSSCCLTALNIMEICWRWQISQLDRNNDMMDNIIHLFYVTRKVLKNYRTLIKLIHFPITNIVLN